MSVGMPIQGEPWNVEITTATVDLGLKWPYHPTALRGAVVNAIAEVSGGDALLHSDWNGRLNAEAGETLSRQAPICYRVHRERALLYLWGPRTGERLAELARVLSVCDPSGRVCPVQPALDVQVVKCGVESRAYSLYETVTPWWPPRQPWQRRPMPDAPEMCWRAWASTAILGGLMGFLRSAEIEPQQIRPIVQVEGLRRASVAWHRDDRDLHHDGVGFHVQFVSNVKIPPDFALGKHTSEGYGWIRQLDKWKLTPA